MEKVNNGGPAFPREDYQANGYDKGFEKLGQEGMSLRDYFAAKAMQAFITGAMSDGTPHRTMDGDDKVAAKAAYIIADAMLKERE